jgi:hypothetical protein
MNDDALDLLAELGAIGLALTREGDSLRVRPLYKLTPTRRQAILTHKSALLAALDAQCAARDLINAAASRHWQAR